MAVSASRAASWTGRLAAAAPVPVYLAAGRDTRTVRTALLATDEVELVASPRHASVLVVAGDVPPNQLDALAQVHDQLPAPRATVTVGAPTADPGARPPPTQVRETDDLVAVVRRVHTELCTGPDRSETLVTSASHPVAWLGTGDTGTGGEGMMGGTPYGRPMAMTDDDLRDGLALDPLTLVLGPFLPGIPTGLELETTLQGDVIQQVTVTDHAGEGEVADRYETEGSIRELELARARTHLGTLAGLLWFAGLTALARRAARLALDLEVVRTAGVAPGAGRERVAPGAGRERVARLARWLRRGRGLDAATAGVGILDAEVVAGLASGPLVRAGGGVRDARAADPAYQRLGFEVVAQPAGDARARWRQLLAETEQALELAHRAGDARAGAGAAETAHGTDPSATRRALRSALPALWVGEELGRAMHALVSLDVPEPTLATRTSEARV